MKGIFQFITNPLRSLPSGGCGDERNQLKVHVRDSRQVQAPDYSAPASRLGFSDELTFLSYMLRRVVVAVLGSLILLVTPAPARSDGGDLLWEDRIDLAGGIFIQTAIAAAHNRVVAVGSTVGTAGNSALAVRAYAADTGALLWEDRLKTGSATVVMNGLWVIVTGVTVDDAGHRDGVVRAYVARTGQLIWQDTWPDDGEPLALDMDAPGLAAVVSGIARDSAGAPQLLVRAYVAWNGALLWEDQPVPSGYTSVIRVTNRSVAVRGTKAFVGASVRDSACLIRAYDILRGTVLWETVRPLFLSCTPAAVATNGKQVLISGGVGETPDYFFVQSYDAETGQFLWEDRAAVGSGLTNAALAVDTEGKEGFVAGWYRAPSFKPGFKEAFVVRGYDAETGALRWVDELSDPEFFGSKLLHALDLVVTRGRVIAVGQEVSGTGPWLTRAYNAETGALLWSSTAEVARAAAYGAPQAVAVDHERIFVAGSGRNNTQGHADFIIRALNAQ